VGKKEEERGGGGGGGGASVSRHAPVFGSLEPLCVCVLFFFNLDIK